MSSARPALTAYQPDRPLHDVAEDLRCVQIDLRKIAGALEVATDHGGLDGGLAETVAAWLRDLAGELEPACQSLGSQI